MIHTKMDKFKANCHLQLFSLSFSQPSKSVIALQATSKELLMIVSHIANFLFHHKLQMIIAITLLCLVVLVVVKEKIDFTKLVALVVNGSITFQSSTSHQTSYVDLHTKKLCHSFSC